MMLCALSLRVPANIQHAGWSQTNSFISAKSSNKAWVQGYSSFHSSFRLNFTMTRDIQVIVLWTSNNPYSSRLHSSAYSNIWLFITSFHCHFLPWCGAFAWKTLVMENLGFRIDCALKYVGRINNTDPLTSSVYEIFVYIPSIEVYG